MLEIRKANTIVLAFQI